jgi:prepilin-type N-terminal cleavage/methylation domain-containing protein
MKRAFTLIEILVVIAIIALLTMAGVTSYKVANQKARDGRRQGDLEQIRAALEMYRTVLDEYPDDKNLLEPDYINSLPADPSGYDYYYFSDGLTYTLCAYLELGSGDCGGNACGATTCNYQVNNPL